MASILFSLIALVLQLGTATLRPENAEPNDNRLAAGRLERGTLRLQLESRAVLWRPDGPTGPAIPVYAFAEKGKHASIPGPMIRVAAGTELQVSVHNTLAVALRFRGLQDHSGAPLDTTVIEPGAMREFRFRAATAGTYYYFARTDSVPVLPVPGSTADAALTGAFIVDPAGTTPPKDERVLLINLWTDTATSLGERPAAMRAALRREFYLDRPGSFSTASWFTITVNGRSWPNTERLSYTVGDTVRWRVINASWIPHPMHLHGFYFDVSSVGNATQDTIFAPAEYRKVVTQPLFRGETMRMTWRPTRAGNWLFHCHIVTHIDAALRLSPPGAGGGAHHGNHAENAMAGLVMGIHVKPAKGATLAGDPVPRRRLRVFVTERANVYGDKPGLSYVLQEGDSPPAPDSLRIPSSTIVLRQNEPTEVAVINRASVMATVHWHGIEVESYYDGVGGWSGWGQRVAPAIAPGDSFVVRLHPDRAGTFIYHAHTNEVTQLPSGLFGPLIVLPEVGERDTTERVFLLGMGGPLDDAMPTINGLVKPAPVELRAGVAHRFRFINIAPLERRTVELLADSTRQRWRALAKDGAELPLNQAVLLPANQRIEPGETFDYEILRQKPETLTLQIAGPAPVSVRAARLNSSPPPPPTTPAPLNFARIPIIVR